MEIPGTAVGRGFVGTDKSDMSLATEVTLWSLLHDQWLQKLAATKPKFIRQAEWNVNLDKLPDLTADPQLVIEQHQHHQNQHRMLGHFTSIEKWEEVGAVFHLQVSEGGLTLDMAADEEERFPELVEAVKKLFPVYTPSSPDVIPMTVWAHAPNGPVYYNREIEVPTWEDIRANYNSDTRATLSTLMDEEWRPSSGGQLILWQGPPGTGKTYALRALGRQWRSWCELHYITDPDALFGAVPAYLLQVVMGGGVSNVEEEDIDFADEVAGLRTKEKREKWRLLVLEDSEELLQVDAKQNVGQALSRLLNLVDGLLGQGLRTLVLVTTNAELGALHPAIQRPGRTAAIVKFNPLDGAEHHEWRLRNQMDVGTGHPAGSVTLAELYAERDKVEQVKNVERKRQVGFSR